MPSHALRPLLEAAEREIGGRARVALVDHEKNPRLAERYAIRGLPTLVFLRERAEAGRRVGLPDLSAVREIVGIPAPR